MQQMWQMVCTAPQPTTLPPWFQVRLASRPCQLHIVLAPNAVHEAVGRIAMMSDTRMPTNSAAAAAGFLQQHCCTQDHQTCC